MYPENLLRRRRRFGVQPFNPDGGETVELLDRAGVGTAVRPRRAIGEPEDGEFVARPAVEVAPPEPLMRMAPAVTGEELRDLGPAPLMRNERGETLTRPELVNTGDRVTDLSNYRQQLAAYRNPKDTEGRGLSALKSAGLMALQGLMTGGLPGAIRGGIIGGIRGAVTPNFNERLERDREVVRADASMGQEMALRQAQLEQAMKGAQLGKVRAETVELLSRPEREAEKLTQERVKEDRVRREVERHNREMEKHQSDSMADQRARAAETARHNKEMERIGVLQAEATQGRFEAEFGAKEEEREYDRGRDEYRDTLEGQNRQHARDLGRWDDAEKARQSVITAKKEFDEARANYDSAEEKDKKYFGDIMEAKRRALGTASGVYSSNYPDLYVNDESGWATGIKGRPAPPEMPKRPAPPQRRAPARRSSRYVAPRVSRSRLEELIQ